MNVLETTGIEVYDASTCTTALVIAPLLSVTTHVQIRAVRPSWEHSTEVLPHLHGMLIIHVGKN